MTERPPSLLHLVVMGLGVGLLVGGWFARLPMVLGVGVLVLAVQFVFWRE